MMRPNRCVNRICRSLLVVFCVVAGWQWGFAQQFNVTEFRVLPNDVSAFITPVRDLNGEACALLKVAASDDFVFSSPLGIVKRKDEVGEIYLYVPRGTRSITIKHPRWGVLRDYRFPQALESHVTYELTILPPIEPIVEQHDTIVLTKTIVDTVAVASARPKVPLTSHVLLTATFHDSGPSWGVMLSLMRRHGAYAHVRADFRSVGDTPYTCDEQGYLQDTGNLPYYTGRTRHANYAFTVGAIHRLGKYVCLFEGIGYSSTSTAWQLAESEGGGYALNDGLTHKGMAVELGTVLSYERFCALLSVANVVGKQWQLSIGVGINIGKR